MAREWRASTWGDEISLEYGKSLRGYDATPGRFRVFGSNGPIGWTSEPLADGPGVILGRKGAYRGVRYSPEPFFVIDTAYYVVPKTETDMRWLYYAIKHHKLGEIDDGSPVPSTTRSAVYVQDLDVPPLDEQRRIADILGTLDDKIELNRRMNETLEAIAQALFKSWFVDFAPVRAKSEGRDPGLPPHLADLFPDSFEDSALGEIPKRWRVVSLGELSHKPQYGFTASADDAPVGPKFLRITDINKAAWINWAEVPQCVISGAEVDRYRVRPGDILIARMADPGHGVMIEEDVDAVFASYLIRFRPVDESFGRFLQYWIKSDSYWTLADARRTGTTRASLNAQVFGAFQLATPSPEVARAFAQIIEAVRGKVVANVAQSEAIASIRDALLPKLISGQIPVRDSERSVARVP